MATPSNVVAWRSPWTEESGGITKSDTAERLTDTHASKSNVNTSVFSLCYIASPKDTTHFI